MDQGQEPKKRRWRRKEKPSTVYSIALPFGLVLHVKKSTAAWWMDQQKVHMLIAAFSIGSTIPEACSYAEISVRQYKYFVQEYPVFAEARKGYVSKLSIMAKMAIVKAIKAGDLKTAWKWLEKKDPEFARPSRRKKGVREERIEQRRKENEEWNRQHGIKPAEISDEELQALEQLRAARRKRIQEEARKRSGL
ncbi:MAG: hypothetical protein IT405_01690 [Candidatus Yanofskybacteria bacterium]|nr:hypothetical protein [Candidatus Yanofskybacteria bacterium]